MSAANHIVTSCKDCKFAQYAGKTQVGCSFNLLDSYRDANIQVIEAEDEEKEFYIINRICMYSRHKTIDVSKEQVLEQIQAQYQIILLLDEKLESFTNTMDSLMQQAIKPKHVTLIKPFNADIQPFVYTKILKKSGMAWRYQNTINKEVPILDSVDACLDIKVFPYYIVVNNGFQFPQEFSSEFNDLINSRFTKFTFLNHPSLFIVPTIYHKQLGGNAFFPLLNKIVEDQSLRNGIFKAGDLIKCLQ